MSNRFKPMSCGDGFCGAGDCAKCHPEWVQKPNDIVLLTCPHCQVEFDITLQELDDFDNDVPCFSCEEEFTVTEVVWE